MYEITENGLNLLDSIKSHIKEGPQNNTLISFMNDMLYNDKSFKNGGE